MTNRLRINKEGIVKIILTFSLLVYSAFVAATTRNHFVFFAMLFSTCGDICIMASRNCFSNADESQFEHGIIAFAIAHISYMLTMEEPKEHTFFLVMIACIAFAGILIMVAFKPEDKLIESISFLYAICIVLNLINSISYSKIAMAGMICFVVSDVVLTTTRNKEFKKPYLTETRMQVPVWVTYVAAQILLLTAVLLKK